MLEISVDTPKSESPVDKYLATTNKKLHDHDDQFDHDRDEDEQQRKTTEDTSTEKTEKDDGQMQVLRSDKEIQAIMEKERGQWNHMLDTAANKTIQRVMYEQRAALMRQDGEMSKTHINH